MPRHLTSVLSFSIHLGEDVVKTVNLTDTTTQGVEIAETHFGINFVADYEKIGSLGWEQFDNIVSRIDINSLRYPGGATAETLFDYRNPNQTMVVSSSGQTLQMETLDEFIDFCNREGIQPTIIIPTNCLLSATQIGSHRSFDASQANDLRIFIENTLAKVDPTLKVSFEIGNEYESYMTSTEYGRVASAVTEIIGQAHSSVIASGKVQEAMQEPDIFVQVWGYSVGGTNSFNDLAMRNQQVISQFDSVALAKIDGTVSHYYFDDGRNAGTDQWQTYGLIAEQIGEIAAMQRAWEVACSRELVSRVSEWNVSFRSQVDLGLLQMSPMMEMFTNFLRSGFDALDFWSAQYHATSLANSSGRLMAAGTLIDTIKPYLVGTEAGVTYRDTDLTAYTFLGSGRFATVVTSESNASMDFSLSGSAFPQGYRLVDAYSIGVDESTADGVFRDLVGLPTYGEPDAKITTTQLSTSLLSGSVGHVTIDPFEALVLIFVQDIPGRSVVYGTNGSEWLYASTTPTIYVGGRGTDAVNYVTSTGAVYADMNLTSTDPLHTADVLISIESILGSSFNDTIVGSGDGNLLTGWHGDDVLVGMGGSDTIVGGLGADTLFGGDGSDSLSGDGDNDLFLPEGGDDTIVGGDGEDTVSFVDYAKQITVWMDAGVAETEEGTVRFREVESTVGTQFDDRFITGGSNSTIHGGGGDDVFQVLFRGEHHLFGGDGDDIVQIFDGTVDFSGGSGNDTVMTHSSMAEISGGSGDDWIWSIGNYGTIEGGEGNDIVFALGAIDTFIFSDNSGQDTVYGFGVADDLILLRRDVGDNLSIVQDSAGTLVVFGSDSSVYLVGCHIASTSELNLALL
jgi:Ca2+-binding RTX toxin-like protein